MALGRQNWSAGCPTGEQGSEFCRALDTRTAGPILSLGTRHQPPASDRATIVFTSFVLTDHMPTVQFVTLYYPRRCWLPHFKRSTQTETDGSLSITSSSCLWCSVSRHDNNNHASEKTYCSLTTPHFVFFRYFMLLILFVCDGPIIIIIVLGRFLEARLA